MRRILFSTLLVLGGLFVFMPVLALAQNSETVEPDVTIVQTVDEIPETTAVDETAETIAVDVFDGVPLKDVFKASDTVSITDPVNGDVWAAGNTVTINTDVANDVIAAASTITINGTVNGDVRVAASTVVINGDVLGNVTAFGATVIINGDAKINGNVLTYAGSVTQLGTVNGNIMGGMGTMHFEDGSTTKGNVEIETGDLTLIDGAEIAGNLTYQAPEEAEYPTGVVGGTVDFTLDESQNEKGVAVSGLDNKTFDSELKLDPRTWGFFGILGFFTKLIFWALVGLLLFYVAPKFLKDVEKLLKKETAATFGWGLLWSIALPMIAVILLITIIGIPVSILLFVGIAVAMLVGKLAIAYLIGNLILKKVKKDKAIWAFMLGIFILTVGVTLPFVGWLVGLAAGIFGFGALLMVLYRRWQERKDK